MYKPTNVISASYGQAEIDLPIKYVERQCNEFLKLGLQGHSILFASGDYGVASFPSDIDSIDGCLGPEGKVFNPQYPSGCPYVTSVGGTQLYLDQNVNDAESVMQWNLGGTAVNFSSSGGFSNYFGRAWYQEAAVEDYFETAKPTYPYYSGINVDVNTTSGFYNRIGRAYPDVAANGAWFPSYLNGKFEHFFGSSLASPLFASVLTLVRLTLFDFCVALSVTDLTSSRSTTNVYPLARGQWASSTRSYTPIHMFSTTLQMELILDVAPKVSMLLKGTVSLYSFPCIHTNLHTRWDPVTGLGTPNYPKMLELFLSLP